MDIEALINEICDLEWTMFDKVNNAGGRASCQQHPDFFRKMRKCQFVNWNEELLESYFEDLKSAEASGRNLLTEKYAWMMSWTHPEEFERIRSLLPVISEEKRDLVSSIVSAQVAWEEQVDRAYPYMRSGGRRLRQDRVKDRSTSFETYLAGELMTYSEETLRRYASWVQTLLEQGLNMALMVAESTALAYGYKNLDDAEKSARERIVGNQ